MRLGAFEINEPAPELKEPHVLAMLRPWVDVGGVGGLVLSWMENYFGARELGKLARPGEFFDFTRYRPTIFTQEGERRVNIPNTSVTCTTREGDNDLIFLHMLEPHNRGEDYVDSILELMAHFGAKRYCLLGSMYDYVPHTRPLTVTGGSQGGKSEKDLGAQQIRRSNYQGPTTITTLVTQQATAAGMETMTLIVHLPQYTQLEEDFVGTVPLMESLSPIYHLPVDQSYVIRAEKQREQIDDALDKNPSLKAIVEQLENRYDARAERRKEEDLPQLSPEVEKFLSEMDRRFREGNQ